MPDVSEQLQRYATAAADATPPVTFDEVRRPTRLPRWAPLAAAAVVLVAAVTATLVWSGGTDSSSISTVDDGAERGIEAPDERRPADIPSTDAESADGIAPNDPALRIEPDGPYRDGQQVTLTWPEGHISDWGNESPLLCSVVADDSDVAIETCEAVQLPVQQRAATEIDVVLSQRVFTPTGYRDCADEAVTCRLLHRRADGTHGATAPLQFTGEPNPASASLSVTEGPGPHEFIVDPEGLTPHPSWLELRESNPARVAGYPAFFLQLCAFESSEPDVAPYGDYLWLEFNGPYTNCEATAPLAQTNPDDPNAPLTITVPGRIYGYGGWSDCRVDHCFVQIRQSIVDDVDDDALTGHDDVVVADLLPFAPTTPLPDPPSIEVVEPGPHVAGQTLTVVVRGLPERTTTNIGVCNVRNPWGCGYLADAFELSNGTYKITLPDTIATCTGPRTCYLELDAKGEGLPPLATAPLDTGS